MKKRIIPFILLVFTAIISCGNQDEVNLSVVSVWVNPQYNDSIITFKRSTQLPEKDYGIDIKTNGVLKERKIIGWCGTPPVAYGDYDGTWIMEDSVLYIKAFFWGGEETKEWKIISINEKTLKVKQLKVEYISKQQ
ncbi:conserved hypothetical protein [uncultured Paludibacter sp.]|nr:conserved hypothetical protein [uncultured Paludibacter sp.]